MLKKTVSVSRVETRGGRVTKVTVSEEKKASRSAQRSGSGRHGDYVVETAGDRVKDAAIGVAGRLAGAAFRKLTGGK